MHKGIYDHKHMIKENNHQWKGDGVKNLAWLHTWLRDHWEIPKTCELCEEVKELDLANKTGIYNRQRKNWHWLCRKCHMDTDGRNDRLREIAANRRKYDTA